MKILQFRTFPTKAWYLSQYPIENGLEIKSISDAIVRKKKADICESSRDFLILIESYQEFVEYLELLYCVVLRTYDNFKFDSKWIWIGPNADLEWGNKLIGKDKVFLGKYDGRKWRELRKEIRENCERRLIVKEEFIELYRHELIVSGII